jgi:hypothetical protein
MLFRFDYASFAIMALLLVFLCLHPHTCPYDPDLVLVGLVVVSLVVAAVFAQVVDGEGMFNNSNDIYDHDDHWGGTVPYSVLLNDDDNLIKKWFLASLRMNGVLAKTLDGQEVAARELQRFGIDPLRVILISSSPLYQQAAYDNHDLQVDIHGIDHDANDFIYEDDDDRYEDDVRPRRRRRQRGYPDGYGQRVRRLLHGLAQAMVGPVHYEAVPRAMINHPRRHPLPRPPRETVYEQVFEQHRYDDYDLSRAIFESFHLNVRLATMLGQDDSARALASIVDWLETMVRATTFAPVNPYDLEERRRRWRHSWRSSAERLPHVLQVLRDLAERVSIRSKHLHKIAIVSQLLHDPYHHTGTDHRRVRIYVDHVQRLFEYTPDGLQMHARAVASFLANREQTARDEAVVPKTIGAIVAFVKSRILEVRMIVGGGHRNV